MPQYPSFTITLPLPTSVNAMHTVSRGFRCPKTKKWKRVEARSGEYTDWLARAAVKYRGAFPMGVEPFTGRLRVDYWFLWHEGDKGRESSDLSNREKCLSDFLQGKFFVDDKQIDEQHHYRRIVTDGESRVIVRIYEIEDRRFIPIV